MEWNLNRRHTKMCAQFLCLYVFFFFPLYLVLNVLQGLCKDNKNQHKHHFIVLHFFLLHFRFLLSGSSVRAMLCVWLQNILQTTTAIKTLNSIVADEICKTARKTISWCWLTLQWIKKIFLLVQPITLQLNYNKTHVRYRSFFHILSSIFTTHLICKKWYKNLMENPEKGKAAHLQGNPWQQKIINIVKYV